MRRTLFLLLAVVFLVGGIMAQDVKPAVSAGSKSLDFSFAGLGAFGIGPAGIGGGLGVTYFLASDAAVRVGLQAAYASASIPANPPAGTPGTDGSQSAFQAAASVDYLMFMTGATARVRPFVGAGVQFGFGTTNSKTAVVGAAVQTEIKNNEFGENINGTTYVGGTTIAARAVAGAEFFLYPELSLSAEYQLNVINLTSQSDEETINGPTTVTKKLGSSTTLLGFGAVGATLHIYF
jgi:outer membrane protein W